MMSAQLSSKIGAVTYHSVTRAVAPTELPAVLSQLLGIGATVIGWSSTAVEVVRTSTSGLEHHDGRQASADTWFGARAFSASCDARWVAAPNGGSLAAISTMSLPDSAERTADAVIEGVRYLVFGEPDHQANGWLSLSAGNVGAVVVPYDGGLQRVAIAAVEYVRFDRDGNADVVEERLMQITDAEVRS